MPANKKYLTASPWQRWVKITAGFFGGYAVMISFFLMLSHLIDRRDALVSTIFFGYIVWAILLLLAFLAKSGWKIWLFYIALTALFLIIHRCA
ncbi:hypothetical protein [Parapedobacter sp. DT-150]|uniref:hypothetical protein n=1 Tax=Parapedobacter sp. DT-150 TaxID=3396162 RepID=UPI003F1C4A2D